MASRAVRRLLLGVSSLAFGAVPVPADVEFVGGEFQVNGYTTGQQYRPAVCRAASGDFVVVWESIGVDGAGYAVAARRYASDGTPQGSQFVVNTYTTGDQFYPALCCDSAGNFVVAWSSAGQDGDQDGVFARRYAADGTPRSGEFRVNTYTTGDQDDVGLCCDRAGNFVVAWEDTPGDGDGSVVARRHASDGTPLGTEFQVNTYTTGEQEAPDVTCRDDGAFVLGWDGVGDGSGEGVFVRRYATDGSPSGTEFQANTYTSSSQGAARLCHAPDGTFVVVWESSGGQDGGGLSAVIGRRFASDGTPAGDEFLVNTYTTGNQSAPQVACDGAGDFTVVWVDDQGASGDVFGQRYASAGTRIGSEFRVNTQTTGSDSEPDIAVDHDGDFVVVWMGEHDGSNHGIFGQRYADQCGDGTVGAGEQCDDGSRVAGACCSATCQVAAARTPCDEDGVACTTDACAADATCTHTPVLAACPACRVCDPIADCVARPRTDCRRPTKSRKASLALTNEASDRGDRLTFGLQKGAATTLADLGAPTTDGDYTLCVFDQAAGADHLVLDARLPAGSGWKARGQKGFVYKSRGGAPDGITRAALKPGADGKASIAIQGRGAALGLSPLGLGAPVTAQLEAGGRGTCFAGTIAPEKNTARSFRGKGQ